MISRNFLIDPDGERSGPGLEYARSGFRFFQVFGLSTELELLEALCVTTSLQEADARSPFIKDEVSNDNRRRKKALLYYGNSFVVSDDFDERLEGPISIAQTPHEATSSEVTGPKNLLTLDFSPIIEMLTKKITQSIADLETLSEPSSGRNAFQRIDDVIREGIENSELPMGTLWVIFVLFYVPSFLTETLGLTSRVQASASISRLTWSVLGGLVNSSDFKVPEVKIWRS
jgi:hypothetical protein